MASLDNILPSNPVGCFALGMILGCVSTVYNKPVGITITIIISFMTLFFYAKFAEEKEGEHGN